MKALPINKFGPISFIFFFWVNFLCLYHIPLACAQAQSELDAAPLAVVSDKMIAQKNASVVEFIGNVKATRLDSILLADSIKIYFAVDKKNTGKDAQSKLEKIVSTGNVRYTEGDRKAFADKAIYTTQDEVLILTGKSAKLITGSSFVTGKKITLLRKQDQVIVESDGAKRVEAVFNPEEKRIDKQ